MKCAARPWPAGWLAAALIFTATPSQAADELRVQQLWQDVIELKRVVREQARRIDELERQLALRTPDAAPPAREVEPSPPPGSDKWLTPASWERIRPGMEEQEVLEILGYPTSVRSGAEPATRTLFYTLQVGPAGFLSGRVLLSDGRVSLVERPTLR